MGSVAVPADGLHEFADGPVGLALVIAAIIVIYGMIWIALH
jgi:hypothetical protein